MRTRERNEEQEKKDESFQTVGDRVRARGRVSAGGPGSATANAASAYLAGEKNPKRIIAGLKVCPCSLTPLSLNQACGRPARVHAPDPLLPCRPGFLEEPQHIG